MERYKLRSYFRTHPIRALERRGGSQRRKLRKQRTTFACEDIFSSRKVSSRQWGKLTAGVVRWPASFKTAERRRRKIFFVRSQPMSVSAKKVVNNVNELAVLGYQRYRRVFMPKFNKNR